MAREVVFLALALLVAKLSNGADLALTSREGSTLTSREGSTLTSKEGSTMSIRLGATYGIEEVKKRPVTKVINLLKDMLQQMEYEAEVDLKVYDKMMCWCITNRIATQKNIDQLGAMLDALMEKISEAKAHSAFLSTLIAQLEADLRAALNALAEAKALREKQQDDFRMAEKDLMQAIQSIKQAISVLDKHFPGDESFLQTANPLVGRMVALVQGMLDKHGDVFTPQQQDNMISLIQTSLPHTGTTRLSGFLQGVPNAGSYTPASGQIFGVLNEMLKTFEDNLIAARKQDVENEKKYRMIKALKEAEVQVLNEQLGIKRVELAEVNEKLAEWLEEKEKIIKAMEGDMSYLKDLNKKCKDTKSQYAHRKKLREDEMDAVSRALAVISGDDAHDLFTRTFNPGTSKSSFMQIQSKTNSKQRQQVSRALAHAAAKFHSKALLRLSSRAQIDAFHKIKDAIETMIIALQKEKADDIKFRDDCIEGYHKNKMSTQAKDRRLQVALKDIMMLESELRQLDADMTEATSDIADEKAAQKKLGEQRDAAHKEFQQQVTDQRDTIRILDDCLQVLKGFYGKSDTFVQVHKLPLPTPKPEIKSSEQPNAPSGFQTFKRQSTGVMGIIEDLIRDTKVMEEEITKDEAEDQAAYEKLLKESLVAIEEAEELIAEKTVIKAKKSRMLQDSEKEKADMKSELEQLGYEKDDLDNSCTFMMKNFDIRQEARDKEVEALRNTIAILSGANYGEKPR